MKLTLQDMKYLLPVLLVCSCLYVWTVSSSISLADTGLFMMVCNANGIAHPPGYPLAILLCHPMMSLPFDGAIPGNLFSTFYSILTLAALFCLCRLVRMSALESAFAAGLLAVCSGYWSQSVVLEVYTLNTCLVLGVIICSLLFALREQQHWLVLGSLFLGLGLSNHWPLVVLSCVAVVPLLFWKPKVLFAVLRKPLFLLQCLAALLLGLSPYLLMFMKSGNPMTMIGEVHSLSDLWLYVSRSTYNDGLGHREAGSFGLLWWVPANSLWQFGYAGCLLIPVGMIRSFRDLPKPFATSLLLLWLANCLLLSLINGAQFNDVSQAYFPTWILTGLFSCAIWFVLGVRFLWFRTNSSTGVRTATAVLLFFVVGVQSYRSLGPDDADWVDRYNRMLLNSLPENAMLVVAGDTQTGPLGYLHYVKGLRSDIELRQQHNMLFSNRLMPPRSPVDEQAANLMSYIKRSARPVFSLVDLGVPAIDHGMYFELGQPGFAFNPQLDNFMRELMAALDHQDIREPFILPYLRNLVYQYARVVVGDAIVGTGLTKEKLERLVPVSATLQGKIWTLHHFVNSPQPSIDLVQLTSLIQAGDQQLDAQTPQLGARRYLLLSGDAYRELLGNQAEALRRYLLARDYDGFQETCEHLLAREVEVLLSQVGCGQKN